MAPVYVCNAQAEPSAAKRKRLDVKPAYQDWFLVN